VRLVQWSSALFTLSDQLFFFFFWTHLSLTGEQEAAFLAANISFYFAVGK
jgi:hypothetical protein